MARRAKTHATRAQQSAREAKRKRDQERRPSASKRGYGRGWQKIRAEQILLEPTCEECPEPATQVDHIIPKSRGGTDNLANLRSLCASCHSRKTAQKDGGFGNRRRGRGE